MSQTAPAFDEACFDRLTLATCEVIGADPEAVLGPARGSRRTALARSVLAWLAVRERGAAMREVAELLGRHRTTICGLVYTVDGYLGSRRRFNLAAGGEAGEADPPPPPPPAEADPPAAEPEPPPPPLPRPPPPGGLSTRILIQLANRRAMATPSLAIACDAKESAVCAALRQLEREGRVTADELGEGGLRAQLWRPREVEA